MTPLDQYIAKVRHKQNPGHLGSMGLFKSTIETLAKGVERFQS